MIYWWSAQRQVGECAETGLMDSAYWDSGAHCYITMSGLLWIIIIQDFALAFNFASFIRQNSVILTLNAVFKYNPLSIPTLYTHILTGVCTHSDWADCNFLHHLVHLVINGMDTRLANSGCGSIDWWYTSVRQQSTIVMVLLSGE